MGNTEEECEEVRRCIKYSAANMLDGSKLWAELTGKPDDRGGLLDALFTANKLVWALVLVKWLNFEVWWYFGGGSFAYNVCASF